MRIKAIIAAALILAGCQTDIADTPLAGEEVQLIISPPAFAEVGQMGTRTIIAAAEN